MLSVLMRVLRRVRSKIKILVISASGVFLLSLVVLVLSRIYSAGQAKDLVYGLDNVPERPVAIVFGAWVRSNGLPSAMLADRVAMAAKLYHAGRVKTLLLTGDNHIDSYNEPEAMRHYALQLGVPDSALVLDYAGFRTYDSCYRAQAIFDVHQAILVTQAFHLDRALLTCNGLGIDSVGVAADAMRPQGYRRWNLLVSEAREFPSTVFALIDLSSGRQPTFLGEPLPIFADG